MGWIRSLLRSARLRFRRDVKNEIFAEILSAWKSSLPPTTETRESLIIAQIVENPEPTYYDSHYRGGRGNNSMGPDGIKRIENFIKLVKEATRNSLPRANKVPFPFCGPEPRNWS
jgi:hypothetical protein